MAESDLSLLHEFLVELVPDEVRWRARAAYRAAIEQGEAAASDWFPARGDTATVRRALSICATCEVGRECSEYATRNNIRDGLWAMSGRERRAQERARRREQTVGSNGNGKGERKVWERWLRQVEFADDAVMAGRYGRTIECMLTALVHKDAWSVCSHVVARAVAVEFIDGHGDFEHGTMLCASCFEEHRKDPEVQHSPYCFMPECDQPGLDFAQLGVMFAEVPVLAPDVQVGVRRANGGRVIYAQTCREHGAGRRWYWTDMVEPQDEAEAS